MTICKKCNGYIGDIGDPHRCPVSDPLPLPKRLEFHDYPSFIREQKCDHCYCKTINLELGNVATADHKVCCNCGNKQKIFEAK